MGILTLIILQMNNTTSDNTQEQPSMIADIKKRLSDAKTNLSSIKKGLPPYLLQRKSMNLISPT